MSKKQKALPDRVSVEDALRLDNLIMRKSLLEKQFGADMAELSAAFNTAWDSVRKRYRLSDTDSVDPRSGQIKRGG